MMFFSSHPIHLLLQDVASIMNALNKKKCSAWVRWLVLFVCSFVQFSNIVHHILYLALCHAFTQSVILNLIILSQIRIGPISKNVLNHFPVFFSFSLSPLQSFKTEPLLFFVCVPVFPGKGLLSISTMLVRFA